MNAHDATATHYCKFGECTNEVSSAVGRYSYCEKHRDRAARAAKRHADELEAAFAASLRETTNGASPDVPAPTR